MKTLIHTLTCLCYSLLHGIELNYSLYGLNAVMQSITYSKTKFNILVCISIHIHLSDLLSQESPKAYIYIHILTNITTILHKSYIHSRKQRVIFNKKYVLQHMLLLFTLGAYVPFYTIHVCPIVKKLSPYERYNCSRYAMH